MEFWFPHKNFRKYQKDIALTVSQALKSKKDLIFSATTGMGKTAAVQSVALKYASENNLKILYFTNRSSNQILPLKEFKKIKQKFCSKLYAGRITCKKDLCPRKGMDTKDLQNFYRICSEKKDKCKHYIKFKKEMKKEQITVFDMFLKNNPDIFMDLLNLETDACPYYLIKKFLSRYATLILLDYQYILNPYIKSSFFKTCGIKLDECILIFDECHNLPEQARNAASISMSSFNFIGSINEINDYQEDFINEFIETANEEQLNNDLESAKYLMESLGNIFSNMPKNQNKEMPFALDDILNQRSISKDKIKDVLPILNDMAKIVEDDEKRSRCRTVHNFLTMLLSVDKDEKFTQFIKNIKDRNYSYLDIKCLDPSYIFKPILDQAYSVICFSGTLHIESFKKLLEFPEDVMVKKFPSPFKKEQRRYIIFSSPSADFTLKNRKMNVQQKVVALSDIINTMKGNVLVIFPSTDVFNIYVPEMEKRLQKQIFKRPFADDFGINQDYKMQRIQTLNQFKKSKNSVLFTIAYGSYSEGVDYKHVLQNVIVIGFPYPSVDYERISLSKYFDKKFNVKDYGRFLSFILPGIQKSVQSAGRVIRSEKDRGLILFFARQFGKGSWMYGRYFDILPDEIKNECIIPRTVDDIIKIIEEFDVSS